MRSPTLEEFVASQVQLSYFIIHNTLENMRVYKFHAYFTFVINSNSEKFITSVATCSLLTPTNF